jgi:hypothetical protein
LPAEVFTTLSHLFGKRGPDFLDLERESRLVRADILVVHENLLTEILHDNVSCAGK